MAERMTQPVMTVADLEAFLTREFPQAFHPDSGLSIDIVEHGAPAYHPEFAYMGYSAIPSGKGGGVSTPRGAGAPSISVGE